MTGLRKIHNAILYLEYILKNIWGRVVLQLPLSSVYLMTLCPIYMTSYGGHHLPIWLRETAHFMIASQWEVELPHPYTYYEVILYFNSMTLSGLSPGAGYSKDYVKTAKLLRWDGHFKPWGRRSAFSEVWLHYALPDPLNKYRHKKIHIWSSGIREATSSYIHQRVGPATANLGQSSIVIRNF